MTEQTWLWIGCIGMVIGAAVIFLKGGKKTPQEETATVLHGIVPLIAAAAYFAMAVGQGSFTVHSDVGTGFDFNFYFARYIDWLFTTPLLLVALSLTAMHTKVRRPGLMLGAVLSDVLMIVTAYLFADTATVWLKWTWFIISCAAFLGVYYVIWTGLKAEADSERADVSLSFNRDAILLSVIWFAYPIVLLIDPEGLNIIGSLPSVAIIVVLDLIAKVGYGLLAGTEQSRTADLDIKERSASATVLRRAA